MVEHGSPGGREATRDELVAPSSNDGPAKPDRRPSAEGIAPLASLANACGNRVAPAHITTHALGLSPPLGYDQASRHGEFEAAGGHCLLSLAEWERGTIRDRVYTGLEEPELQRNDG